MNCLRINSSRFELFHVFIYIQYCLKSSPESFSNFQQSTEFVSGFSSTIFSHKSIPIHHCYLASIVVYSYNSNYSRSSPYLRIIRFLLSNRYVSSQIFVNWTRYLFTSFQWCHICLSTPIIARKRTSQMSVVHLRKFLNIILLTKHRIWNVFIVPSQLIILERNFNINHSS